MAENSGPCVKCKKNPSDHYRDDAGELWCIGNVGERYSNNLADSSDREREFWKQAN